MPTYTLAALQTAIGVTLLAAAAAKLRFRHSLGPFLVSIGLPLSMAAAVTITIPWLEGLLGTLLISGVLSETTSVATLLLTASFAATLTYAKARGVDESCHCFGALDTDHLSWIAVVRAAGLLIASSVLVMGALSATSAMNMWSATPIWAAGGILFGGIYIAIFALLEQVSAFERGTKPVRRASGTPELGKAMNIASNTHERTQA